MIKNTIQKINKTFEDHINNANLIIYKNQYKNKDIHELEKLLEEKETKIKELESALKRDNIIKSVSVANKGLDYVLLVAIPGGIPLVMVKRNLEPLRILYYQKIAIKEIMKEKRKEGKQTMLKEELQYLSENYTPVNYLKFKEKLEKCPANVILENVSIISVNEDACGFFSNYTNLNAATMKTEELSNIYNDVVSITKSASNLGTVDEGHLCKLREFSSNLNNIINDRICGSNVMLDVYRNDLQSTMFQMPIEKKNLEACRLGTGNASRAAITMLEFYLKDAFYEPDKTAELFTHILPLTDTLVLTECVAKTDIMKTPNVMRKNLIETIRKDKTHLMSYKYILNESCSRLEGVNNNYTYHLCKLRDEVESLCEGLVKAKVTEIGDKFEIEYDEVAPALLQYKVLESLYKFTFDTSEDFEVMSEQLTQFVKDYNEYTVACEATNKKKGSKSLVWKAGHAVEKKTHQILNNGRDAYDTNHRNTTPVKKAAGNVEKLVNHPLNQIINIDKEERRKRLVEGRFRLRVWKLIRKYMITSALSVVAGPIIAAIGFIGSFALDKTLDKKVKKQIIHEMETELKIVEEKIEDAKGERKDKEKYQLMRIKAKLEKEINRIQFGLGSRY